MHRKIKALKLANPPLVVVICQVRISPVLKMSQYIPSIQEELRLNGFPRFAMREQRELTIGPEVKLQTTPIWRFADKDNTSAIVIGSDFAALETNRYSCFEDFCKSFEMSLDVLSRIVKLGLWNRLGLRYVNAVLPRSRERLDEYLRSALLGLDPDDLGVEHPLVQFEFRAKTSFGNLAVRLHQNDAGNILPPDGSGSELDLGGLPKRERGEVVTLLDIDHYSEQGGNFDAAQLIQGMWQLHEHCEGAFRYSVTQSALKNWGREDS